MRAKDKCPSCFQPVLPTDFLCANCELILDPSQAPEQPTGDVSVVRRMLEAPQRGLPAGKPPRPPKPSTEGLEGPTRKLDLGPELSGVPVVVATLSGKSVQLSEFEAWLVSLIDGLSDSFGLAKAAGLREFELRVVLRTLQEKRIIDFADEPLSDADLEMPSVMGTLDEEDEMTTAPGVVEAPGASSERRDGRFMAPPSRAVSAASIPPVPERPASAPARSTSSAPPFPERFPAAPPRAPTSIAEPLSGQQVPVIRPGRAAVPPPPPAEAFAERSHTPIVMGKAAPPVLTPTAGRPAVKAPEYPAAFSPSPVLASRPPAPPLPKPERTDPRIAYSGQANRRVLDALKKVKRIENPTPASSPKEEKELPIADVLARDTLQVALRMEQGGRLDEAIRFLEKSISQSPEAASLYNRLGIILMRERADYRRAETLIRKAVELAPENNVYTTNLQQVLSQHAVRAHR